MLALTDSAPARLVIAASAIAPHDPGRWFKDIAAKLDSPRARRQAKARSRRAQRRARLPPRSFPIARSRAARAASSGLRTHGILPTTSTTAAATPCRHFAALVAAPTPIAAARSNCSPPPAMARPRR